MATESIRVVLRGWASDGRSVAEEFASAIRLEPRDLYRAELRTEAWRSSEVLLVDEALKTHADAPEPHESFREAVARGLSRAAERLERRPNLQTELAARGMKSDVFVVAWIDQDQFDLELPAAFLCA